MILTCRRAGFVFSGALHLALVAAVVVHGPAAVPSAPPAAPLALNLDMFEMSSVDAGLAPEPATAPLPPLEHEPLPEPRPVPPETRSALAPPVVPAEGPPVEKPKSKPLRKKEPPKRPERPRSVDDVQEGAEVSAAAPKRQQSTAATAPRGVAAHNGSKARRVKESFLAALAKRINRKKFYPRASRRRGEQGTVLVSFVIEKHGQLRDLRVQTSSGFERLDQAALDTLAKVSPFLPIPDSLGQDRWPISVPIAFRLRR